MQRVALRCAELCRVVREGVLRLGDAHRQVVKAVVLEGLQVLPRCGGVLHVGGAVDLLRDGLDGRLHTFGGVVERVRSALGEVVQQGLCKLERAVAALRPHIRLSQRDVLGLRPVLQEFELGLGIRGEAVERNHRGHTELANVFHVALKVDNSFLQSADVLRRQVRLGHARVVFDGADRGHNDGTGDIEVPVARLNVEELLRAQVGAEAGLREHDVRVLLGGAGGDQGVAAVGDVGKRAAVDERRRPAESLHQVRVDRILEQRGHRALGTEVAGCDRLLVVGQPDGDVGQALLQILQVRGQTQNRHDLGGGGDGEAGLRRHAVGRPAQAGDDVAQRAVVDIHTALPGHTARIDVERVALVDVVVNERGQRVVGTGDRVEIAGEVQVDLFHRDHLGVTAAGGAALDAHHGAERRLTQGHHGVLAQLRQRVRQTDQRSGLALARRGWRNTGDHDELAGGVPRALGDVHLGHVLAVRDQRIVGHPSLLSDLRIRSECVGLSNFDVSQRLCSHAPHTTTAPMA